MYWIYIKGFVCCQNIFSHNPSGMAYLGFYQQNHLVRISNTPYVDFIDIPTKYPHAKTCHLMRSEPKYISLFHVCVLAQLCKSFFNGGCRHAG